MIIETVHVDFDELTAMASKQSSSRSGTKLLTLRTISSRLVPNIPSSTPYVPPTKNDWEILFQPMFDEYLNPPPNAPSTSTSQTPPETPSLVIPLGVEEADHDIEVVILNHVHSINQPPEHINKWTKDHPIDNVIGDPSRPVSTRQQLQDEALLCYFDAFLSSVEPKSYKDELTESCWIEAIQEELNEFERLEVWELVPHPDCVMLTERVLDTENPNHVYKLKKALYGLKQAPRAWYDFLSSFLLSQKFTKGTIDPTLFVRREGKDILFVQIYVDDIIFASTKPDLCETPRGIFLNQSKYALESIKKYGLETCEPADTPMAKPTEKHLHAVKRIFRYLRGTINIALWYPKDSCIALIAFADADHAGCW
ncbi:retrovirus-related pol polyprotein from transposon TNT 1-94 [Tanacetum coccineum]